MIFAIFLCSLQTHLCVRPDRTIYPSAADCRADLRILATLNSWPERQAGRYWLDATHWAECEGKPGWRAVS